MKKMEKMENRENGKTHFYHFVRWRRQQCRIQIILFKNKNLNSKRKKERKKEQQIVLIDHFLSHSLIELMKS